MGWYLSAATHATKNKTMKKEFLLSFVAPTGIEPVRTLRSTGF